MTNKKGVIFVVSGPSGTGKGTIMSEYFKKYPQDDTFLSISATTREPRPIDTDGVTYHFKTRDEFEKLINEDGLAEWAEFCGNYYGTPKKPLDDNVSCGRNVVLEIEVQGAKQVMECYKDAVGIFVLPPSFTELEKRLVERNTESVDVIKKRLERAREEIKEIDNYDYILINDNLEQAVEVFRSIMIGESQKTVRNKTIIEEVCK